MFSLCRCFQPKSLAKVWKFETQRYNLIHTGIKVLTTNSATHSSNKDFIPIYKFPFIRPLSVINKLCLYQTVLTVTSFPVALVLNYNSIIETQDVQLIAALGITGCVTLLTAAFFTQKFIGFIYYNEEKNIVKISYNDFWGRRKNIEIPASDIVPLSDLPSTPLDGLYLTFRRFSTKETLKFNMSAATILNKEMFNKVL